MSKRKTEHALPEDPFAEFADLYELTHSGKYDDLPFYLDYARQCGSPILEVGAGTGRVTIVLAEAGFDVHGIDLSDRMLKIAREKIAAQPAEIRDKIVLERQDMSKLDAGEQRFALALMPYGEFAHVLERERQQETLHRVFKHLLPGGRLIIGMSNWDAKEDRISFQGNQIARMGHSMPVKYEGVFEDPRTGQTIVRYLARGYDPSVQTAIHVYIHEIIDTEGRMIARKTNVLPIRYIFRYEMELFLEQAGLMVEDIFGYYDRRPFQHDSKRMIFVARKP